MEIFAITGLLAVVGAIYIDVRDFLASIPVEFDAHV